MVCQGGTTKGNASDLGEEPEVRSHMYQLPKAPTKWEQESRIDTATMI